MDRVDDHRIRPLMRAWLAVTTLLLFACPPALAWNAAGHRLSALIAWQQLDNTTQSKITRLLIAHPDREKWAARGKSNDAALDAFLGASTWPDEIRSDYRFYDQDDTPTPALPGFPDTERHRDWHYINRSLSSMQRTTGSQGQLDKRLLTLSAIVGDPNASIPERAYALPWLIHLVADAHQPLHVVSRYDRHGASDEGGNRLRVETPLHPRLSSMNLHAYWDDLPGPPWLHGDRLKHLAAMIVANHPPTNIATSPQRWLDESFAFAKENAYPVDDNPTPTISEEFHRRALSIAQKRIAEAGYRLADQLRRLLKK